MMKKLTFLNSSFQLFLTGVLMVVCSAGMSAQCLADAANIEITGTGETMTSICVDGTPDPIDVSIVSGSVGANNGWIITDQATGDILATPPATQTTFDLDGAGVGVCDIYYVRYETGTTGISVGNNLTDIVGCFDLSNAIEVYRSVPAVAGDIEITGTGETMTSICVDGTPDPIDVSIVSGSVGTNNGWIITDQATGDILATPPATQTTFDLNGAGVGVCDIYYVRYETGTTGISVGNNLTDIVGCFDLSNAIEVYRSVPAVAGDIEITGTGETMTSICVDGTPDPIDVSIVSGSVGANNGWIITDQATGDILATPPATQTTFDLDGAGVGVCDIYYVRYETGTTGIAVGNNLTDITGCFDLSNPIVVTRNQVDAAAIEITGGGTSTEICVDGTPDPIDVTIVGTGMGSNNGWVITDRATGQILGLPPGPPFDLDGAGAGICDIWYIRYEDGLSGLATGQNVANLNGCFDLSNPISVTRTVTDAASIVIEGTSANTELTICAGDSEPNPIGVRIVGTGIGTNNGWIITDDATGEILALPAAPPFDLNGAGAGVCNIYYIRYEAGLMGLATGELLGDLNGSCFDLSNPITVNRNGVDAAAIEITGGGTTVDICAGDGEDDPIDVTIVGTGLGSFNGWLITDQATGTILGLPPGPPFNLEGAGDGVCDIWYIRHESGLIGLEVGENVDDLTGCFALSNPITVNREGVDGAAIQIVGSTATETSICADDGEDDLIDVEVVGDSVGANGGWIITDNATGEILGVPPAPPFNLEGAGAGICDIWYIRYADGLTGLEAGQNISGLVGCYDLSNPVQVTRLTGDDCDILAVDDFDEIGNVTLFPNPANEEVQIVFNQNISADVQIAVYDLVGRQVLVQDASNEVVSLNVASLPTGTYLVTISSQNSVITKRLIKQ